MTLADQHCQPCRGHVAPLESAAIQPLLAQIEGWHIEENRFLRKSLKFKNFKAPLQLANLIAEIAEEQGHHPDLLIMWGKLQIDIWTHAAGGLTEADFILAAKIDRLINQAAQQ